MLWDSGGGWVLCPNRECNSSIKLLDPELLNPLLLCNLKVNLFAVSDHFSGFLIKIHEIWQ